MLAARGQGDSLGVFRKAAKEVSDVMPPLEYYWQKDYDPEVPLPWSHLQGPLPVATLKKHLLEAQEQMLKDSSEAVEEDAETAEAGAVA